jgi:hypothetical protein
VRQGGAACAVAFGVAALDDEAGLVAVEGEVVVEAFVCEVYEVLCGDGGFSFFEFEFYGSFGGF